MTFVEAPARRRARISRGPAALAAMLDGASFAEIAAAQGVTAKKVEQLVRGELRKRWIAPAQDYARLQIARLEAIAGTLKDRARKGDLRTIDRMLKVMDRLDRYHGFTKLIALATDLKETRARGLSSNSRRPAARPRAANETGRAEGGVRRAHRAARRRARPPGCAAEPCGGGGAPLRLVALGAAEQRAPAGDWIYWLILAGRGAGKTRTGAETVRAWAQELCDRQPDRRDAATTCATSWCSANPACWRSVRATSGRTMRAPPSGWPGRMARSPDFLGRGAGSAARQAAHEAVARRTRRLAAIPTRSIRRCSACGSATSRRR